jgi:uncharacterized protein (UPF0332 family)
MLQAEQLIKNCQDGTPLIPTDGVEADLRTAISRLYFSVFLNARDLLNHLGYGTTQEGKCHTIVRQALTESRDNGLKRISKDCHDLNRYRARADYDLDDTEIETINCALEVLKQSRSTHGRIDAIRLQTTGNTQLRQQITSILDVWVSKVGPDDIWKK